MKSVTSGKLIRMLTTAICGSATTATGSSALRRHWSHISIRLFISRRFTTVPINGEAVTSSLSLWLPCSRILKVNRVDWRDLRTFRKGTRASSPDEVSLPSKFDVELALNLVMVMYYERRRFIGFLYHGVTNGSTNGSWIQYVWRISGLQSCQCQIESMINFWALIILFVRYSMTTIYESWSDRDKVIHTGKAVSILC